MGNVSSDELWEAKTAIKVFTDREDPQEAFERKYRVLSENWRDSVYVLCYYGIGGIGKTSFVDKLCRVIRGVEGNNLRLLNKIDCHYIRYDFGAKDAGKDQLSILLSFRKQLGEMEESYKFFRFDSALLLYAKKSGDGIKIDKSVQSLLEKNPWLDTVVSAVGTIPVASWVTGVIQAIDKSAKIVKETISKHMEEARYYHHLNEMDGMEMNELREKLYEYFILDMRYNMRQISKKPLVIFLDTYERYIDTLNEQYSMITEDYWLRKGSRSVIRSIPGVLWVITGREKLNWAENGEWEEMKTERPLSQMSETEKEELAKSELEQHLLGDLSAKDAIGFLKKAGISNDTLCKQLYKLTNGTPLFLDMCVETYYELCKRGIQLEIEQYGRDLTELISRYLINMNDANREMAYFLASLGVWNDESVQRVAKEATVLHCYTFTKYKEFLKNSFIIKNLDGSYYMHVTVQCAVIKNADREIVEEIGEIKFSLAKKNAEADTTLTSNVAFEEYIKMLIEKGCSYDEFYENLGFIKKKFRSLKAAGCYDLLYTSARDIYHTVVNCYSGTGVEYIVRSEYGEALRLKGLVKEAWDVVGAISLENICDISEMDKCDIEQFVSNVYYANGKYKECLRIEKIVYEQRKAILGEKHPDTLSIMSSLAVSYAVIGEKQKALEIEEKVYEQRKAILGENHPDTLKTMNNLAVSYNAIGEKQKALELRERVCEQRKAILGENHPDTLRAVHNLANSYDETGEKQKALELRQKVYEQRKEILGENHPDTLKSIQSLANSYDEIGEKQKALELGEKVCEQRKEVLGENHPDTLRAMHNLAITYAAMGEKQKALELKEKVYEKRKEVLGENHPDTLRTMNSLAIIYAAMGEKQKGLELLAKRIELME